MTDLRTLLDTPNVTVLRLGPDDVDVAREAIMADAKAALLSAAQIIHPGVDLTNDQIAATLQQLARTIDRLVDAMKALNELTLRSVAQNKVLH
jgi:hypothetical protein